MTTEIENNLNQAHGHDAESWPILSIDYALYEELLENSDASEEEKRQFIQTLWNIIVNFVDLGFGIHPLQQACEQPLELSTLNLPDMLGLKVHNPRKAFTNATKKGANNDL